MSQSLPLVAFLLAVYAVYVSGGWVVLAICLAVPFLILGACAIAIELTADAR